MQMSFRLIARVPNPDCVVAICKAIHQFLKQCSLEAFVGTNSIDRINKKVMGRARVSIMDQE